MRPALAAWSGEVRRIVDSFRTCHGPGGVRIAASAMAAQRRRRQGWWPYLQHCRHEYPCARSIERWRRASRVTLKLDSEAIRTEPLASRTSSSQLHHVWVPAHPPAIRPSFSSAERLAPRCFVCLLIRADEAFDQPAVPSWRDVEWTRLKAELGSSVEEEVY